MAPAKQASKGNFWYLEIYLLFPNEHEKNSGGWRRGEVGVDLCSYLTFEYEMMPSLSNFYGMGDVELLGRFENLEIG